MRIICLALSMIMLSGCSHYYYSPNAHNVPLFKEKGEARATAIASTGDDFSGLELQTAYSPIKNFGLTVNVVGGKGGSVTRSRSGRGLMGEIGAGYYTELGGDAVFELYGGVGLAHIEHRYGASSDYTTGFYNPEGKVDMKMFRAFIQPNIGFATPYFDAAFSLRMCLLSYTNINISKERDFSKDEFYATNMLSERMYNTFEPAVTLRGGWKYVKLQTQIGVMANSPGLPMNRILLSAGLYVSLPGSRAKRS